MASQTQSLTDITSRKPEDILVCTSPSHELFLESEQRPKPGPGQCLIHVRATGICGSDVHFWKEGHIGEHVVMDNQCLGHESAGVVIDVGEGVERFTAGDRVALEAGIPCSKPTCYNCRTGKYHGCPDIVFFSSPPHPGTMRRYHLHPENWLHRLPDELSFEEGSLLEPFSVALAGIECSGLRLGDPVLICGSGPIGLVTLLAASAAGANPIAITDVIEHRLQIAKQLCPRVQLVRTSRDTPAKEAADQVKQALGQEAKIVVDCTGQEQSIQIGIYSCQFGGRVHVTGCGKDFQTIPFAYMGIHEIELRFQFRYANTYPKAISLVSSGVVDLKQLVTHRFKLEEGKQAFKIASDPAAEAIKVQILDD